MLQDLIETRRSAITAFLKTRTDAKARQLGRLSTLGPDVCRRLFEFAANGKMIRGALVWIAYGLSKDDQPPGLVEAASAIELFQSALLIHDDIMDRDPLRRGGKSIYSQYAEMGDWSASTDAHHVGESLGICAGDIAFFLAFEIVADLPLSPAVSVEVLRLFSEELSSVGVAQMQDVYWGARDDEVGIQEILKLYRYKTGRYTFSLPMVVGGTIAGQSKDMTAVLKQLGEQLGSVFQIRDDDLGLFGSEGTLGKPVGSDLRSGKKTLYYHFLRRRAEPQELAKLMRIFGNPQLDIKDVQYVRDLTTRLGIQQEIAQIVDGLVHQARETINSITVAKSTHRQLLVELLDYLSARTK